MAKNKRNNHFGKKFVSYNYTWNGTDANGVANSTVAAHPSGIKLPVGAIIDKCYYNVTTTFTSLTDAATIGIGIKTVTGGSEDLKVAIAISDATNVWDAGIHGTLVNSPAYANDAAEDTALETIALDAAIKILLTAESDLTINNHSAGAEALTAGAMTIYLEYWLP